jgi:serine/threonine protein kinase
MPIDDTGRHWELLTERLEAFVSAWDAAAQPPALADYLPDSPPALRRLVLVELVKVDLDYRWQRKMARPVEEYGRDYPELAAGGMPCDLIYEEYHIRKRAGEEVQPGDYLARFPAQADALGRLFGLAAAEQSTALWNDIPRLENLQAGDRIEDFDLLTLLGKGAFASVFLARQRSMGRLVALKVSANRGSEPQTLAQLDHPHIVRVFDQRALPDRGLRLLYMQYVAGGTLQDVIAFARSVPAEQRSGRTLLEAVDRALAARGESPPAESFGRARLARMGWAEVVSWVGIRLADALAYASGRGVLHRDVKPANVLLTAEGSPQLADFNVSFSSKLEGATPAAFFGGSLAYMSPEHLEAFDPNHPRGPESLDARSDLYALGVMLWELLTGSRPFADEEWKTSWSSLLEQMAEQRRGGMAASCLTQVPARCPPGLVETLRTCLAADTERRFASGQELVRELTLCLEPRAQGLLGPNRPAWRRGVCRWPIVSFMLAAVWPNMAGSIFNVVYNRQEIVARLSDAEPVFWATLMTINGVAFPLGIAIVVRRMWPVVRTLRGRGEAQSPEWTHQVGRRCLGLGHYTAVVCFTLWLAAGPFYPLVLGLAVGPLPAPLAVHFVASLTLCGLIAAVYPFFGITFLCVRAIYPALVRRTTADSEDLTTLWRLSRQTGIYLLLAAAVPMLAVTALAVIGSQNRLALGVLSAGGLVGFGLAFWVTRIIQADLQALAYALQPQGAGAGRTNTTWEPL